MKRKTGSKEGVGASPSGCPQKGSTSSGPTEATLSYSPLASSCRALTLENQEEKMGTASGQPEMSVSLVAAQRNVYTSSSLLRFC